MIPNHTPDDAIVICDNDLIDGLKSDNHETLQSSQIIIDYLSYKTENKSAVMIPKLYRDLLSKSNIAGNEELIRWVESFFCEAKIGISPKNPNSQEYGTVIEYLSYVHNSLILFITDDKDCIKIANKINPSILVGGVKDICKWIQILDKTFAQKIYDKYFGQSS